MRSLITMLVLLISALSTQAQWTVQLKPRTITGMPGLQSFAAAEFSGRWLFIGGRIDGLHQRQPPRSFLASENNTHIWLVDQVRGSVKSVSVSSLPVDLADQLSSTNVEFEHIGTRLYLIGGYGFSRSAGDHATFNAMIIVDLPKLIQEIDKGALTEAPFKRVVDDRLAVTGGGLGVLGDELVLAGGQRFDGRYNPMNGPSFTQKYTDEVRFFRFDTTGPTARITDYRTFTNAVELHRRDYNFVPIVRRDGTYGYTMFSGVFQIPDDSPYLTLVDIDDSGYVVRDGARQYLSHYHSAVLPMIDSAEGAMHTVFFGGMSQYDIDGTGTLTRNDSVPFRRTISRMSQHADGTTRETKLTVSMPDLLGAGAEFMMDPSVPTTAHGVVLLHQMVGDTLKMGSIVGGIRSSAPNIFWVNDGTQSSANATIYDVSLIRTPTNIEDDIVVNSRSVLSARILSQTPTHITVAFALADRTDIYAIIHTIGGEILAEYRRGPFDTGKYDLRLDVQNIASQPLYISIHAAGEVVTLPVGHLR
ncbi:MAG: hypothetical protein IPF59_11575 [Ignavibacteria bacterium]|nr:hypothetical protein [Ignavibacteria bacterium]